MEVYTTQRPHAAGWYWARENQKRGQVVKVFVNLDLLTVYSPFYPGIQFDVYDFDYWYGPVKENERMPPFRT